MTTRAPDRSVAVGGGSVSEQRRESTPTGHRHPTPLGRLTAGGPAAFVDLSSTPGRSGSPTSASEPTASSPFRAADSGVQLRIDYLATEWADKAAGFVSYGGVAAGTRAVQQLKQVLTALKMVTIAESVNIPFFPQFIDEAGNVRPTDAMTRAADAMLNELLRITTLLRPQVAEVSEASDAMVLVR